MSDPPPSLFDDEPEEDGTVVDSSFWTSPKIPVYPTLATLGRFQILGRIGRGGMAEVYLAREPQEDGSLRHVVIKRVLPEVEDHPKLLALFREEGRTAVRLFHPNVCHVYECGVLDGRDFMALEWVYGTTLQDIIRRSRERRPLPWPLVADIIAHVAAALHYVHHARGVGGRALGIVHRDVSPHNIMVSWEGQVKLLDFGIAKSGAEEEAADDPEASTKGKHAYMAPEQVESLPVDARTDIFALGICLYELATGRALYDRGTLLQTLEAVVREPPPSMAEHRPDAPAELDAIAKRALMKAPHERFRSADEMASALRALLAKHAQVVSPTRIAMTLGGLFDAEDKVPLPPNARQLTGSFQAVVPTDQVEESMTFEVFSHDSKPPSGPPPPPSAPLATAPAEEAERRKLPWLQIVALVTLFFSTGCLVGSLVLWLTT